jgi:hypothetical protein
VSSDIFELPFAVGNASGDGGVKLTHYLATVMLAAKLLLI